jgi:signal recognition particle receptor subunit beta
MVESAETNNMMDVKVILVGDKHTGKSQFVSLYADTIGQEISKEEKTELITH